MIHMQRVLFNLARDKPSKSIHKIHLVQSEGLLPTHAYYIKLINNDFQYCQHKLQDCKHDLD